MNQSAASFVAGLLTGIALTAGVAAAVVRLSAARQAASPAAATVPGATPGSAVDSPSVSADLSRIEPRSLRLGHGLPTDHPVHLGLVRFGEVLGERTGGRIGLSLFPNGELGDETVMIEQLQAGTLDLAKASAAPLGSFAQDFGVFSVPYAFRDSAHFWAVLDGPVGDEILGSLEGRGLHGLCYFDAGARSFYTSGEPILSPSDVAGRKVRVMQSRTAMEMVSAFGGAPTPMAYSELYSALQTGLVDAAENNPPSFYASRHYEVARRFSLNEHARVPDVLLVSQRVWRSLSAPARAAMRDTAREASRYQRRLWAERTDAALAAVRELGVAVYEPDPGPFREAVAPLRAGYAGSRIGELLEAIDAAGPMVTNDPPNHATEESDG